MLAKVILASLVSMFSAGLTAQAASVIDAKSIVGTWILEKSDNPMPDGSVVPYCTGVHGMIIYTAEGYVSVALNCAEEGNGNEPADISGRKFLYAGRYTVSGTKVTHHLANASQTDLIGTSFTRDITINDNTLILSGENQGQAFAAYWVNSSSLASKGHKK